MVITTLAKKTKKNKELNQSQNLSLPVFPTPAEQLKEAKDKAEAKANEQAKPEPMPNIDKIYTSNETGQPSGFEFKGETYFGATPQEIAQTQETLTARNAPTQQLLAAEQLRQQQAEGAQLQGQVGQFNQLGVEPTGLNIGEAFTTGLIGLIPKALGLAVTGAGVGAVGGTAVAPGIGTAAGAIIGGVAGFVSGISSSMISNMKNQRSDTTTAQQRVLDEGKQTMKDWSTLAEADPANKAFYLSEYNKVSAQIDQAYRQMKLDTSKDVAKFETALPNLAEFEAFYAPGGERDVLDLEMQNALLSPASPEYKVAELAYRRQAK